MQQGAPRSFRTHVKEGLTNTGQETFLMTQSRQLTLLEVIQAVMAEALLIMGILTLLLLV
jgi:hypothetical protein